VRGFSDYAGPTVHSRLAWLPCCLPSTRNEVGVLIYGLFAAQSPRPPMPLSTLQETPRDVPSKIRGQDGFASSFPVGLLHPLQHAGLPRRFRGGPSSGPNRLWKGYYGFPGTGPDSKQVPDCIDSPGTRPYEAQLQILITRGNNADDAGLS